MPDTTLPALLSLASHELRGPTGVLRGYLRLLDQDATIGVRPRRVMTEMARAADRLAALLDELSELAQLKDGRIKLTLRSVSLRSVLNQAVQAVELPDNQEGDLDVVVPSDVRMRADEARLRAVFCTLIVTLARAQTSSMSFDLRLERGRRSAHVVVQPRTLGHGTVVEQPVDFSRGGTGLQLPIAAAIVQAHGGRLRERWVGGRWVGFVVKL